MTYEEIFRITPGNVVPGGRSFPVNATAQVDLDVRNSEGVSIQGREVSKNDPLTVIDVSESRQLALVQYPSSGQIRQGYVTNNSRYITYNDPENWYNGTTKEEVINYDGSHLGWLSPYETATILYRVNGLTQVVYNTDLGVNTKSGFVRYAGGVRDIVHVDIPYPNVTNAQVIQYGTSGKGRELRAYKIGNGRNSFIFNCEIHGWEDHWPADGIELTKIGNQIIEHFQNNSTGDFTLYVIPATNPDGVSQGWTNNGPGRCTIVGAIDCNRDFPVGFTPGGDPRNYTGAQPLSVPESRDLANFISGVKSRTSGKTFLIDMHGWEGSIVGSSEIGTYFTGKLGLVQKGFGNPRGFLIQWANSIGITSAIMELPTSIYSHADIVNLNCAGKIIQGLTELMGATSGSTGGNYNGHINSGVEYVNVRQEPNTTSTILGKLYGNNQIQILAKVKPNGDSYYWYKIVFIKDGEKLQAYVREDFVTTSANIPVISDSVNGHIKSGIEFVNIREIPTTVGNVPIGKLYGGNPIDIVGKVKPDGDNYYWYKFKYNGGYAYVREDFVTTDANIPIISDTTRGDLRLGSQGEDVRDLQSKLAYIGLPVIIDGIFGKETEKCVIEFQKVHGLYVDGVVGQQTMSKLNEEVKKFETVHTPSVEVPPDEMAVYKGLLDLFNFNFSKVLKSESKFVSLGQNINAVVTMSFDVSSKVLNGKSLPTITIKEGKFASMSLVFPESINVSINRDKVMSVGKTLCNGLIYMSIDRNGVLSIKITGTYKTKDGTKSFSESLLISISLLPDVKPGGINDQQYMSWNQILNGVDMKPAPANVGMLAVVALGIIMFPEGITLSIIAAEMQHIMV